MFLSDVSTEKYEGLLENGKLLFDHLLFGLKVMATSLKIGSTLSFIYIVAQNLLFLLHVYVVGRRQKDAVFKHYHAERGYDFFQKTTARPRTKSFM